MGGDEVDACPGLPATMIEYVARRAEPRSDRACRRGAAPEVPHRVAEFVVPLGPAGRKAADLVAARPAIPRLGNQFYSAQLWVLTAGFQKTALTIETVGLPREYRAE